MTIKNKLILLPNIDINVPLNTLSMNGEMDRRCFIHTALYWDEAVIINSTRFKIDYTDCQEIQTLKKEGMVKIIEANLIPLYRMEIATYVYNSIYKKAIELLANDSNTSCFDMFKIVNASPKIFVPTGGETISLLNALAEPSIDTELDEILEFRQKRNDDLQLLMNHIKSLEIRVKNSESPGDELKKAVNEIDSDCHALIRLYKEKNIKFNLSNLKVNYSLKEIAAISASVYAGLSIALPQTGAIVGALTAGIASTMEIKDAVSFKQINKENPFNYTAKIATQLNKNKIETPAEYKLGGTQI